jgi:hypothetical protein
MFQRKWNYEEDYGCLCTKYQENIRKTTKYAKKGLSPWLRAFTHTFVMVHKGMSCLNFEDFASSPQSNGTKKNKVGSLEAPRSIAITI